MVGNNPVCSIQAVKKNPNLVTINYFCNPKYRQKGYATMALQMLEKIVFQDHNIYFTSLTDMSKNNVTTHMALKNGYIYDTSTNTFCKINPNLSERDITSLIKSR